VFIEAGRLIDEDKGGDIWNTESFDQLYCRFNSIYESDASMPAFFVNQTVVGCTMPTYTQEEFLQIDLTFDAGITYSANTVGIYLIEEPSIVALNNTEYYYTYNEQVYIEVTGTGLDKSGFLQVRVVDQVLDIEMEKGSGRDAFVFEMPL